MNFLNDRSTTLPALCLGAALSCISSAAVAFEIALDYTYGSSSFFDDTAKMVLESAASYFESVITDDLTAIESDAVEGGGNNFTATFDNPSDSSSTVSLSNYDVAADTIVVYVGAQDLGSTTLAWGGPGGYIASGTSEFVTNAVTRGETQAISGVENPDDGEKTATDFATWGGAVSFNTNASWYYDTDPSTDETFTGYDFYSVALHELGHVLGIGTSDSWNNQINGNEFTGPNAVAANGGENVQLNSGGDHWQAGTDSTVDGTAQEAAMDPDIASGQRKRFTDLDNAALEDIGWEVQSASAVTAQ